MANFFQKQPSSRNGVTQTITISTSSAAATNGFGSQTYQVRLVAAAAVNYRIGDGAQTATAADPLLPANTIEYVTVTPGQKIAAIGSGASTMWVTEIS